MSFDLQSVIKTMYTRRRLHSSSPSTPSASIFGEFPLSNGALWTRGYSGGLVLSGNHETPGRYAYYGPLALDVVDIDVVVKYLKSKYGYVVTMMVSHSRGSVVTMRYLCTYEDAANVKYFVNVSGRYRMVSGSTPIGWEPPVHGIAPFLPFRKWTVGAIP